MEAADAQPLAQIGKKNADFPPPRKLHALHVGGVPRHAHQFHAGRDGAVAFEQCKFPGFLQRHVIFREVAGWSRSFGLQACSYSPRCTT